MFEVRDAVHSLRIVGYFQHAMCMGKPESTERKKKTGLEKRGIRGKRAALGRPQADGRGVRAESNPEVCLPTRLRPVTDLRRFCCVLSLGVLCLSLLFQAPRYVTHIFDGSCHNRSIRVGLPPPSHFGHPQSSPMPMHLSPSIDTDPSRAGTVSGP